MFSRPALHLTANIKDSEIAHTLYKRAFTWTIIVREQYVLFTAESDKPIPRVVCTERLKLETILTLWLTQRQTNIQSVHMCASLRSTVNRHNTLSSLLLFCFTYLFIVRFLWGLLEFSQKLTYITLP